MRSLRRFSLFLHVLLFVVAAAAGFRWSRAERDVVLPERLGALSLVKVLEGDAAVSIINRMHGKAVTPRKNSIGFYDGPAGSATLYVSVYGRQDGAASDYEKMAALIRSGNEFFGDFQQLTIGKHELSVCYGQGQAHVFFRHAAHLYWLAVDPPLLHTLIRDLVARVK